MKCFSSAPAFRGWIMAIFENNDQLTENKLILLYIIDKLGIPLSGLYITEIVLEPGLMNYFSVQAALNDLVGSKLLTRYPDNDGIPIYDISKLGHEALHSFKKLIAPGILAHYNENLSKNASKIRKEMEINAYYFTDSNNEFYVRCFVRIEGTYTIDIRLPAADKKEAGEICANWKNNTASIYLEIIKAVHTGK